MREKGDK